MGSQKPYTLQEWSAAFKAWRCPKVCEFATLRGAVEYADDTRLVIWRVLNGAGDVAACYPKELQP